MSTSKSIFLSIMLLIPLLVAGQSTTSRSNIRKKLNIGNKTYVVTSGDVTRVVNLTGGLSPDDQNFIYGNRNDKKTRRVIDSIYTAEIDPNITLEKAMFDVNKMLQEVEKEKDKMKDHDGLGFRLSQGYVKNLEKEREAKKIADSLFMLSKKGSVQELGENIAKFENKPTYYLNGNRVDNSIINFLIPSDILGRTLKTNQTASGNPNGEIWYDITPKAMARISKQIAIKEQSAKADQYYNEIPVQETFIRKDKEAPSYNQEMYDMSKPNPYEKVMEEPIMNKNKIEKEIITTKTAVKSKIVEEPFSNNNKNIKAEPKKSVKRIKERAKKEEKKRTEDIIYDVEINERSNPIPQKEDITPNVVPTSNLKEESIEVEVKEIEAPKEKAVKEAYNKKRDAVSKRILQYNANAESNKKEEAAPAFYDMTKPNPNENIIESKNTEVKIEVETEMPKTKAKKNKATNKNNDELKKSIQELKDELNIK